MKRQFFPVTEAEARKNGVQFSSKENKEAQFPQQLRELRKEKGVSQAVLASELGVSKSTIGLYETGDTLPDAKTLHDLAVYFGVTSDYLLGLSKAREHENHVFAEETHFSASTIMRIVLYSRNGRDDPISIRSRLAFEYLLCTNEFQDLLDELKNYLDMSVPTEEMSETDTHTFLHKYASFDKVVSEQTGGRLHVIRSDLVADVLKERAQSKLAAAFESIKATISENKAWDIWDIRKEI